MDRLATHAECRQQGAYCRKRAEAAADEQVRALWIAMAQVWTKLADKAHGVLRLPAVGVGEDARHDPTRAHQ
jgi:hypothetical protein